MKSTVLVEHKLKARRPSFKWELVVDSSNTDYYSSQAYRYFLILL